jgi:Family of unknown function (DUF6703)
VSSEQEGDTALRKTVAARSRGTVVWLSMQPPLLIPAGMLVLMLVGLLAPVALGVPALVVVALFVGWLGFLSWPVLALGQRAIRVVMVAVVVFAAVGRLAGWF